MFISVSFLKIQNHIKVYFCLSITTRSYKIVYFIIQFLKKFTVVILPYSQRRFPQCSPTDVCKHAVSGIQRKIMIIAIFKPSYLAS